MIQIRKQDIEIEHVRRAGPGGQHKNKRSTGVRVTHLPTNLVVMATERRSQLQNLEAALARLADRLTQLAHKTKPRKKTKPSRASKEKRLELKRERSQVKRLRHGPEID
jgi:protein subunit release factor B